MTTISSDLLLHPELLTNEQLLFVIHERHLRMPSLEQMSREALLELFHQYCVPHAQRRYRDTGRGKLLNRLRDKNTENFTNIMTMDVDYTRQKNCHIDDDRLKPPPDLLSGHIKRIKLCTDVEIKPANNNMDINIIKRKCSMMDIIKDSPPVKRERKLITWP